MKTRGLITAEQLNFFDRAGYLHVPDAISQGELKRLRTAANRFTCPTANHDPDVARDLKYGALVGDDIGAGDILCRLEYTLAKDPAFLSLLGHPAIISCAASLHRNQPMLVTWEDLIIKSPLKGFPVPFHQDLLYQSTNSMVFSIGVYFDDSDVDPLLVIPGTQRLGPLSEESVRRVAATRESDIRRLPVRAGDMLIHNVLMIHGSGRNKSTRNRRVLYFEFRTVDQVLFDSPWDARWLDERLAYIPAAIMARERVPELAQDDEREECSMLWSARGDWAKAASQSLDRLRLRVPHDPDEWLADARGS